MKKKLVILLVLVGAKSITAQDTFSILAFDSITREVGAAGASCVDLFNTPFSNDFICELFPDTGAIATQAQYIPNNQANARYRMRVGNDPQQILTYVTGIDVSSATRQYGVVKMDTGIVRTAAFTGTNCQNYKGHIVGPNYTIHGNILLGQQVLDSMEAGFLRAKGDLACKLMGAMLGARMVGADTRCAGNNSSSLFAFLKVSLPTDTFGKPSYLISMRSKYGDQIEPIDSLQTLFLLSHDCSVNSAGLSASQKFDQQISVGHDLLRQVLNISSELLAGSTLRIIESSGREVYSQVAKGSNLSISTLSWAKGVYSLSIKSGNISWRRMIVIQ